MSDEASPEHKLKFTDREQLHTSVLSKLRKRYGRNIYISDVYETKQDDLVIHLGAAVPQDLSDSRNVDNVYKFTKIPDAVELDISKSGDYYSTDLPDRSDIRASVEEKRTDMIKNLDTEMARHIYDKLVQLPSIRNQLNPIFQILKWARRDSPVDIEDMKASQTSDNTENYVTLLEQLDFVESRQGMVYSGEKLEKYDLDAVSNAEFAEQILGEVVQEGINSLRDRLGITMLNHYPKYSNAYYYTAFERDDPDVWLDLDSIKENLDRNWGERVTTLTIKDKMEDLDAVGVLEMDENQYVTSNQDVYNDVKPAVSAV